MVATHQVLSHLLLQRLNLVAKLRQANNYIVEVLAPISAAAPQLDPRCASLTTNLK